MRVPLPPNSKTTAATRRHNRPKPQRRPRRSNRPNESRDVAAGPVRQRRGRLMEAFARLYAELDALKRYFATAGPTDAAWAAYFLAGGRPRQAVPARVLREMAVMRAGIDD